eukprot:4590600-Heterocapsa_arctica.AAC.1
MTTAPRGSTTRSATTTKACAPRAYTVNELAQAKSLGWNVYVSHLRFVVISLRFVVIRWTTLAPWTVS